VENDKGALLPCHENHLLFALSKAFSVFDFFTILALADLTGLVFFILSQERTSGSTEVLAQSFKDSGEPDFRQ
jgi:hypothetical protein